MVFNTAPIVFETGSRTPHTPCASQPPCVFLDFGCPVGSATSSLTLLPRPTPYLHNSLLGLEARVHHRVHGGALPRPLPGNHARAPPQQVSPAPHLHLQPYLLQSARPAASCRRACSTTPLLGLGLFLSAANPGTNPARALQSPACTLLSSARAPHSPPSPLSPQPPGSRALQSPACAPPSSARATPRPART